MTREEFLEKGGTLVHHHHEPFYIQEVGAFPPGFFGSGGTRRCVVHVPCRRSREIGSAADDLWYGFELDSGGSRLTDATVILVDEAAANTWLGFEGLDIEVELLH